MKKIFNSIGVVFVCFVATGFYFYLLGTNAALEVRTVAKVRRKMKNENDAHVCVCGAVVPFLFLSSIHISPRTYS